MVASNTCHTVLARPLQCSWLPQSSARPPLHFDKLDVFGLGEANHLYGHAMVGKRGVSLHPQYNVRVW